MGCYTLDVTSINADEGEVSFDVPLEPDGHGSIQFKIKIKLGNDNFKGMISSASKVKVVDTTSAVNVGTDANWHADLNLCEICHGKFTLLSRRHHCRSCGINVCNSCSSNRQTINKFGNAPVRICSICNDSSA